MEGKRMGLPSSSTAIPMVALIRFPFAAADCARIPSRGKNISLPFAKEFSYIRVTEAIASLSSCACGFIKAAYALPITRARSAIRR
jgi:hypothetical protein